MFHPLRSLLTGGVATLAALAALLAGSPSAAADPWSGCGPHSLEEKVVRVFPRTPAAAGPTADSSALPCGNRYFGLRRIETGWPGVAASDRHAVVDAAVARALVSGATPTHDPRSGNWTYGAPDVEVVLGPGGLIIDARPPRP